MNAYRRPIWAWTSCARPNLEWEKQVCGGAEFSSPFIFAILLKKILQSLFSRLCFVDSATAGPSGWTSLSLGCVPYSGTCVSVSPLNVSFSNETIPFRFCNVNWAGKSSGAENNRSSKFISLFCTRSEWSHCIINGRLIDWSYGWLIDHMVDWLIDWSVVVKPPCFIVCRFQIAKEYERFKKYMKTVKLGVFFGGMPIAADKESLSKAHPHVVVGTPGRILALVRDKALNLGHVKHFVLDECDKVLSQLDMRKDIQAIFKLTPREKQVMMFSATLPKDIRPICRKFMQVSRPSFIFLEKRGPSCAKKRNAWLISLLHHERENALWFWRERSSRGDHLHVYGGLSRWEVPFSCAAMSRTSRAVVFSSLDNLKKRREEGDLSPSAASLFHTRPLRAVSVSRLGPVFSASRRRLC